MSKVSQRMFRTKPSKMSKSELNRYHAFCTTVIDEMEKIISYHAFIASREIGIPQEDIQQEMKIKLFQRLYLYDSEKSELITFCYMICKFKRMVMRRKYYRRMKKYWNIEDPVRIYDKIYYDNGEALEVSTFIEDKSIKFTELVENNQVYDIVHEQLRGEASEIFTLIRQGIPHKDIAEIIGKSRQTVANIIRRKIKPVAESVVNEN